MNAHTHIHIATLELLHLPFLNLALVEEMHLVRLEQSYVALIKHSSALMHALVAPAVLREDRVMGSDSYAMEF